MNPLSHLKLIRDNPGVYKFISDAQLAEILLQLLEQKSLFKSISIKDGVDGKDGVTPQAGVDYMSRQQQESLIRELVSHIKIKDGQDGRDGVDGADAEISEDDIQFIIDTVYDALFPVLPVPLTAEEIRDRLELLIDDERLDKDAIKGIKEIEDAIEELRRRPVGTGGGGLSRNKVQELINTAIDALDTDSTPEFEKINKNLSSYPYVINYTGNDISSIVYTTDGGTITKTFNYTGLNLTSIVLSGALPTGLTETTKTLSYSGSNILSVTYT